SSRGSASMAAAAASASWRGPRAMIWKASSVMRVPVEARGPKGEGLLRRLDQTLATTEAPGAFCGVTESLDEQVPAAGRSPGRLFRQRLARDVRGDRGGAGLRAA